MNRLLSSILAASLLLGTVPPAPASAMTSNHPSAIIRHQFTSQALSGALVTFRLGRPLIRLVRDFKRFVSGVEPEGDPNTILSFRLKRVIAAAFIVGMLFAALQWVLTIDGGSGPVQWMRRLHMEGDYQLVRIMTADVIAAIITGIPLQRAGLYLSNSRFRQEPSARKVIWRFQPLWAMVSGILWSPVLTLLDVYVPHPGLRGLLSVTWGVFFMASLYDWLQTRLIGSDLSASQLFRRIYVGGLARLAPAFVLHDIVNNFFDRPDRMLAMVLLSAPLVIFRTRLVHHNGRLPMANEVFLVGLIGACIDAMIFQDPAKILIPFFLAMVTAAYFHNWRGADRALAPQVKKTSRDAPADIGIQASHAIEYDPDAHYTKWIYVMDRRSASPSNGQLVRLGYARASEMAMEQRRVASKSLQVWPAPLNEDNVPCLKNALHDGADPSLENFRFVIDGDGKIEAYVFFNRPDTAYFMDVRFENRKDARQLPGAEKRYEGVGSELLAAAFLELSRRNPGQTIFAQHVISTQVADIIRKHIANPFEAELRFTLWPADVEAFVAGQRRIVLEMLKKQNSSPFESPKIFMENTPRLTPDLAAAA